MVSRMSRTSLKHSWVGRSNLSATTLHITKVQFERFSQTSVSVTRVLVLFLKTCLTVSCSTRLFINLLFSSTRTQNFSPAWVQDTFKYLESSRDRPSRLQESRSRQNVSVQESQGLKVDHTEGSSLNSLRTFRKFQVEDACKDRMQLHVPKQLSYIQHSTWLRLRSHPVSCLTVTSLPQGVQTASLHAIRKLSIFQK